MSLNPTPQQELVIQLTEGPHLVIAGPGSGKTFTLVERIVHLVTEKHVAPESLLVATFTEKAAGELVSRITRRLLEHNIVVNVSAMYVGTLHSICLRILEERREYTRLKKNFTLMDQFDQSYFIYQRLNEFEELASLALLLGREQVSRWNKALNLCAWLNKLSEECIDPLALQSDADEAVQALGKWYARYLTLLEEENLLDFSVVQLETVRLLEAHSDTVLAELQERFRYILIDEYQDTNTVQERLLLLLAGEHGNLCVVGDDDQGLYRFRGATIRNILEFPHRFADGACQVHPLTVNYRSDPEIIDFYNHWMDGSTDAFSWEDGDVTFRYTKHMEPAPGREPKHPAVVRVSGIPGKENWHEQVLAFLEHLRTTGLQDWNQVAFLFRSVRHERVQGLAHALEEAGIPVYAPRSNLFFEREEVRLLMGALLFIFPQFKEIRDNWRFSPLDIWDYYDQCLTDFAARLRLPEHMDCKNWCVRRAREIQHMVINKKPLDWGFARLFYQFLQFSLFSRFLEPQQGKAPQDERPARNMAVFSQLLVKFEYLHHIVVLHPDFLESNLNKLFNHFFRYVMDGGISEFEDADDSTPAGAVSFMTIHQSKGLEFPVTVVDSLEATPRKQYTDLDELLQNHYYTRKPFEPLSRVKEYDFKRLYYTAFSRAKDVLVLSCQEHIPQGRGQRNVPSAWFAPFYKGLPNWKEAGLRGDAISPVGQTRHKREYSYTSHILLYEGCPRQYQFFRHWEFTPVREAPMLFGTLVHQTIEDIHKAVLKGEADRISDVQVRRWFDVNYANLSHKERIHLAPRSRENAYAHVMRYVEKKAGSWEDIRATEVDVSLVKNAYILTGKIDLIRGETRDGRETVEIVDFKATPKPNQYQERHLLDRYRRQLEIYAHLVEERHGLAVSGMKLYYTGEEDSVPTYAFPYKRASIDATIAAVDAVVGCVERREFSVPERTEKLCKECDLKAFCDGE